MEEVDKILIHSLRQTGTDVGEDVQSVKRFSSELIVEAVVKCLRVIDPALGSSLSHSLPPGMSARFRVGMSLAQACQDLGYKGEIGYQTFLYSNEPEIRSLLMFLVEKLPRESAEALDQPAGKSVLLQKLIAAQIKAQLALPWLPPSCRLPLLCKTQIIKEAGFQGWSVKVNPGPSHSFHSQPLSVLHCLKVPGKKQLKEENDYHREFLPPVTAQPSQHASVPASLLELHAGELSAAQEWQNEWNSQGLLSRLTPEEYRSRKRSRLQKRIEEQLRTAAQPHSDTLGAHRSGSDLTELLQSFGGSSLGGDILAKGTRFTHTEKFTFTQEPAKASQQMAAAASSLPSSHQSEEELQARQQEELASLQQQLQQLSLSLEEVGGDMRQLTVSILQVSDELKQKELSKAEKEDSVRVKKQTIDLMPDAENNLAKLQALVEGSAKRVVNLAAQWEKRRAPLIDEHRRLKELCSNQEIESSRKLSEIKELHNKIRQSAEESKKKEALYKQLITEFENLPKDVSRSAYTARILEIVGNIRKQKEEITKILSDTKELQKEINNLTGKLDRTFAVTDELVFKDAKKDESVRKSYKYLAALHENCTQLIQTIEDTGTIMREIRDLEEQIETENGKKTVSNLEKILEDYKAIRQENSALAAKIREA
ncbi:coiled-coil domain-containing protein 22 isoform X2 [Salmo salar]|uniref:Coiled-coil domain-containing protein 22 n=1 Tax=Salmo salar TaxID=8030 RepID=A0A1S3LI49_SALSA|nr:coiled-coil domain-containing protein 22 isoform X2 [Salmo salar]|eukprot:XP_013990623.1 PREDICTED: coiled-coil domain-containing protein 22 isoform X1 [Salmo salar]